MSMQASGSGRSGPEDFERELRSSLYRFDCPDAHTLGEYQIGVLDPQESMRIAGHAAQCDECQADLRLLRQFLAEPIEVPDLADPLPDWIARGSLPRCFDPRQGWRTAVCAARLTWQPRSIRPAT